MNAEVFAERVENRLRLMSMHGINPNQCMLSMLDLMDGYITRAREKRDAIEEEREQNARKFRDDDPGAEDLLIEEFRERRNG